VGETPVAGAAGCLPEVSGAFKTGFFYFNPSHRRLPDNSPEVLIAGSPRDDLQSTARSIRQWRHFRLG
jgi:hypothetical protein